MEWHLSSSDEDGVEQGQAADPPDAAVVRWELSSSDEVLHGGRKRARRHGCRPTSSWLSTIGLEELVIRQPSEYLFCKNNISKQCCFVNQTQHVFDFFCLLLRCVF